MMTDDDGKVVRFQPRPKPKPTPKPAVKAYRPSGHGSGQPAINWSRAPKALVIIAIVVIALLLVGGLADWIARIGMG